MRLLRRLAVLALLLALLLLVLHPLHLTHAGFGNALCACPACLVTEHMVEVSVGEYC